MNLSSTHTLKERIELIIREEINKSGDIDGFIQVLTNRILEITQDEIKFKRG